MLDYKSTSNPGFQDSPRKEENAHLELTLSYASGRQKVTRQAESNARAVDPDEGRCLIENCDEARAVVFAHYVPRCLSDKKHLVLSMMDRIEWYWNMRHNTLNLDTRRNIFRAGATVHRLFDNHSWFLIPDETIIQTYHNTLTYNRGTWIADRALFPNIPDRDKPDYFEYKLIPTPRMDEIALHCQAGLSGGRPTLNDFTTYVYPFVDIPLLRSHLHPKFVILGTGQKLKNIPYATQTFLVKSCPALVHVLHIYDAWVAKLPSRAFLDKSYKSKKNSGNHNNNQGDHLEDGRTAPRRLQGRKRPRTQNNPDDSPTPASGQADQDHPALKREPSFSLFKKLLKLHDKESEGKKWTDDTIHDWSKQCHPLPKKIHHPWEPV